MGTKIQSSRLIGHISLVEMRKTVPTATVLLVGTTAWVAQSTHHRLTPPPPPPPHDRSQNHSILSLFLFKCQPVCVVFGIVLCLALPSWSDTCLSPPPPRPQQHHPLHPTETERGPVPRVNTLTDGVCRPPDSIAAVPRLD